MSSPGQISGPPDLSHQFQAAPNNANAAGNIVNLAETEAVSPRSISSDSSEESAVDLRKLKGAKHGMSDFQLSLMRAIGQNNAKMVSNLLKNPENLNFMDQNGQSPIHLAAQHASPVILNMLIDHGALVNARNGDSKNALALLDADDTDYEDNAELLIDNGAEVPKESRLYHIQSKGEHLVSGYTRAHTAHAQALQQFPQSLNQQIRKFIGFGEMNLMFQDGENLTQTDHTTE